MELNPYKLIETELSELEIVLQNSIYSDIELATEVSSYIVRSGGKENSTDSYSFSCKNSSL